MNEITPNGFIIYTMIASVCFGTALFWVIVEWLRADERSRQTEEALREAKMGNGDNATVQAKDASTKKATPGGVEAA